MMLESSDFAGTPQLDYEGWMALAPCGGEPQVSEPRTFAGWMRPLRLYGFPVAAIKVQCGSEGVLPGSNPYQIERTHRHVRRAGAEIYNAVFQVTGRSVVSQNDQAVALDMGDVAIVDASRPSKIISQDRSAQWLSLRLPRQPLVSHLGFEPQGGSCGRRGTIPMRLLSELIQDAIDGEASLTAPADGYMHLAVYDLLGALFASSDPFPHQNTDKLFRRICGIIKDRFADPDFGPSEVAAEVGISLRYLQKLFTARDLTCIHYLQSLRLEHAARLLQRRAALGTGQPLSQIAYACGFNDYSYFFRRFRHRFGHALGAHSGSHGLRGR
jgi:AraC family transcriptional activator of tynA and feaB